MNSASVEFCPHCRAPVRMKPRFIEQKSNGENWLRYWLAMDKLIPECGNFFMCDLEKLSWTSRRDTGSIKQKRRRHAPPAQPQEAPGHAVRMQRQPRPAFREHDRHCRLRGTLSRPAFRRERWRVSIARGGVGASNSMMDLPFGALRLRMRLLRGEKGMGTIKWPLQNGPARCWGGTVQRSDLAEV